MQSSLFVSPIANSKDSDHPLINGILIINASIKPITKLIPKLIGFLYKTIHVAINVIVYKIPLKSKYPIPKLKQLANIINTIKQLIIIDNLFSLLLYQHI